ncbi:unnamed protein product, partial [Gadus morhua 'NCC']
GVNDHNLLHKPRLRCWLDPSAALQPALGSQRNSLVRGDELVSTSSPAPRLVPKTKTSDGWYSTTPGEVTRQGAEMSGKKEVDGKKEEQRRRAIEGVVDITKLCLMEMNQEELADPIGGP